jgi:hypothetical protein
VSLWPQPILSSISHTYLTPVGEFVFLQANSKWKLSGKVTERGTQSMAEGHPWLEPQLALLYHGLDVNTLNSISQRLNGYFQLCRKEAFDQNPKYVK